MSPNPDLTLYHAPRTRSIRVRWLLEEMGLPYRIKPVQFSQRPAGDEAYADIHPLRKVPALTDGDTKTFESLAIMQYLMGRYGPTPCDVPAHDPAYGDYLKWLHFGESGMLMPVSLLLAHTTLLPEDRRDANLARLGEIRNRSFARGPVRSRHRGPGLCRGRTPDRGRHVDRLYALPAQDHPPVLRGTGECQSVFRTSDRARKLGKRPARQTADPEGGMRRQWTPPP